MSDDWDWSFLENQWQANRSIKIMEELFDSYSRYMKEVGPDQMKKKLAATSAVGDGIDDASRAVTIMAQVSAQGVLVAVAMYLAKHEPAADPPPES